jgi:sugar lactone lactonase
MPVSILSETPCALGEGPSYDVRTDTLFWFDILGQKLHGHDFKTGKQSISNLPVMASAIFSIDDARQLVLSEQGFHTRFRETAILALHTPVEIDNSLTRSNDARAHQCGAIWFGTMAKDESEGAGKFYHFYKGKLTVLIDSATIPNSICFSPKGDFAYYVDTPTHQMMRMPIDPQTALPTGKPELFYEHSGKGWIDGSVCDADGNIWNARWGAGEVACISPEGKVTQTIDIPLATQTSCPAFVGKNLDRMAVTTANKLMSQEALNAAPDSGKTFAIDWPFKGRAEPDVHI